MSALSSEIRFLGAALGRVISQLEGQATFETVEKLRTLAKASRQGDSAAAAQLAKTVARLTPEAAIHQAMAFTLYFELVNLAEENFRVMLLRRRRAAQVGDAAEPMRESIEAAIKELQEAGVASAEMQRLVDKLCIELVFTAHPTESKRRTLLTKLQRLAEILRQRHFPEQQGDAPNPARVEREIASLWLTDRSRVAQPEVTDEARTGLWYFDTTLFETLPRLQSDMVRALARHYPEVLPPQRWLTFGSWIGGDRDGNPNVTPAITAEVTFAPSAIGVDEVAAAGARAVALDQRLGPTGGDFAGGAPPCESASPILRAPRAATGALSARALSPPPRRPARATRSQHGALGDEKKLASEAIEETHFSRRRR